MGDSVQDDVSGNPCVTKCEGGGDECGSEGGGKESWVPSLNQQPVIRHYPSTEFFGVGEKGQSDI